METLEKAVLSLEDEAPVRAEIDSGEIEAIDEEEEADVPLCLPAKVPLLNHHTSGVRMEWYRDDLAAHQARDPYPILVQQMLDNGFSQKDLDDIITKVEVSVQTDFERALKAEDPLPEDLFTHDFAPTTITEESGVRSPEGGLPTVMVDSALSAVEELMREDPACLLYGRAGRR